MQVMLSTTIVNSLPQQQQQQQQQKQSEVDLLMVFRKLPHTIPAADTATTEQHSEQETRDHDHDTDDKLVDKLSQRLSSLPALLLPSLQLYANIDRNIFAIKNLTERNRHLHTYVSNNRHHFQGNASLPLTQSQTSDALFPPSVSVSGTDTVDGTVGGSVFRLSESLFLDIVTEHLLENAFCRRSYTPVVLPRRNQVKQHISVPLSLHFDSCGAQFKFAVTYDDLVDDDYLTDSLNEISRYLEIKEPLLEIIRSYLDMRREDYMALLT